MNWQPWECRAKAGDKVVFAHPHEGSDADRASGELLTKGQVYTLRQVFQGNFVTELVVDEVSGCFNSIQFEPAGPRAVE